MLSSIAESKKDKQTRIWSAMIYMTEETMTKSMKFQEVEEVENTI
jgi:hypothetical protein